MNLKTTLFAGLVCAGAVLSAAEPKFDAAKGIMEFGSKRVIVKQNGTFEIYSEDRLMTSANFFFRTPYSKAGIGNSALKKITPKYDGGPFCQTAYIADPKTKSITVKGILPFHKPGEKPVTAEWIQTLKMLPGNKVDYTLKMTPPDGCRMQDHGVFFSLPNAEGFVLGDGTVQLFKDKQLKTNPGKTITVKAVNQDDVFKIDILSKNIIYASLGARKALRMGAHPSIRYADLHLVFDLMKCK